jgi:TorA maturation chaperone TorD
MESVRKNGNAPMWLAAYAPMRADGYAMLASLLGREPTEEVLAVLQNLQWEEDLPESLDQALQALRWAARECRTDALGEEYRRLFVGLGCGEMIPYASWYREGKLQYRPLAALRSDLMRLGLVRQAGSHEAEDHAGALCECMALISHQSHGAPYTDQGSFFRRHLASWMGSFFQDLMSAKSAGFYRTVGSFGRCWLECESRYLRCDLGSTIAHRRRNTR